MEPLRPQNPALTDPISIGCEWVVDAIDCIPDRLRQLVILRRLCDSIVQELKLHVVGAPKWHQFPGEAGVTGLYLLSESHLACHTYPEVGMATFNLYCCRSLPEWPWTQVLQQELGAAIVEILRIPRGQRENPVSRCCDLDRSNAAPRAPMPWESVS